MTSEQIKDELMKLRDACPTGFIGAVVSGQRSDDDNEDFDVKVTLRAHSTREVMSLMTAVVSEVYVAAQHYGDKTICTLCEGYFGLIKDGTKIVPLEATGALN